MSQQAEERKKQNLDLCFKIAQQNLEKSKANKELSATKKAKGGVMESLDFDEFMKRQVMPKHF